MDTVDFMCTGGFYVLKPGDSAPNSIFLCSLKTMLA